MGKKSLHPILGPGQPRRLRPVQDLESRVLLYDLLNHGNISLNSGITVLPKANVPKDHWFIPVRRYVSVDNLYSNDIPDSNQLFLGSFGCDGSCLW